MKTVWRLVTIIVLTLGIISGCTGGSGDDNTATPTAQIGVANPASTYCLDQGNKLEIRTASDGGQYGVCIFPDGSECEEWAYFRGECTPKSFTPAPAPGTSSCNHHDNDH